MRKDERERLLAAVEDLRNVLIDVRDGEGSDINTEIDAAHALNGLDYVEDVLDDEGGDLVRKTPLPALIIADIIEAGGERAEMNLLRDRSIPRTLIASACAELEQMGMLGRYEWRHGTAWELTTQIRSAIREIAPAFISEERRRRRMRGPQFDSPEDGKDALATVHDISPEVVDELFNAVDKAAAELVRKYGVEDEVDEAVVREYLRIAFCEDIAWMCDAGVWGDEEDIRRIVDEMDEYHGANTRMMVGRVASRNEDMMRLSGAIMQDTFSRE